VGVRDLVGLGPGVLVEVEVNVRVADRVTAVDALRGGTLNPAQLETLRALRVGLVALSEQLAMEDVKVPV
jgi:hypothetical protein